MSKIEDWSLAYELLRPIGYLVHRLAHRNFIVHGNEKVPRNEPVIFAPNHQNALSDALAVILSSNKQPVFLGRADMFKNKLAASLLRFFKINPVYRIRDGKETLERNQEIFEQCVEMLKHNRSICIYPEAAHIGMKSMLPHKKAVPRITMLVGEKTNDELDVKVVPVGIYYSHYYKYKRDLIVSFGDPISSKDYYSIRNEEGEAKAIQKFRKDLHDAIYSLVVQVDDRPSYHLYEQGFEMAKPVICEKLGVKNNVQNAIRAEKFLVEKVANYLNADESGKKEELVKKAQRYKKLKERFKLNEELLEKGKIGFAGVVLNFALALIMLPFAAYAIVANGWLFYLTHYPHQKLVKDKHFYSTISFGLSFIIFPFWYIGQFFILHAIFHNWWIALALLVFSIPSGIVAWELGQLIRNSYLRLKIGAYSREKNKLFLQLKILRDELMGFYENSIRA